MKKMNKLLALVLAMVMVLGLAASAFAEGEQGSTPKTNTIIINETGTKHVYKVYQILNGTYNSKTKQLENIDWGSSVTVEGNAAEAFAGVDGNTPVSVDTANNTVTIGDATYTLATEYGTISYVDGTGYKLENVEDGYYVIIDVANQEGGLGDDAYSAGVVKVVNDITVTPKSATPNVDKQVQDEAADAEEGADANGWGETADHSIYEVYKYKLIAKLPNDVNMDEYEHYYLQFKDSFSKGVSFLGNVQVSVTNPKADTTVTFTLSNNVKNASQAAPVDGPAEFTVTIQDLMQYVTTLKGTVVTVTYDAYLNRECQIGNNDANQNKVSLEYSNNPAWNGEGTPETGETGPDFVFTFTYDVQNTKIDGTTKAELAGAEFRLYTGYTEAAEGVEEEFTGEIALIFDETVSAYRPIKSGETGTVMKSNDKGVFNIVGLDAGTYYLKETKAPVGYNDLDKPIEIIISATHSETAQTNASVTFNTATKNTNNKIENFNGATLPETGGIGTTIFYVLGGMLVVCAVVLMVSKKRMSAEG